MYFFHGVCTVSKSVIDTDLASLAGGCTNLWILDKFDESNKRQ